MKEKWKIVLFIIFSVIEAALLLFFLISAFMFFMEENQDLFAMIAALSIFPGVCLAVSIGEIIRIRKEKRNVIINSVLMKFTAFLLAFTVMYSTPFFAEVRIASFFFGVLTILMFTVTCFYCKNGRRSQITYHPSPLEKIQFDAYKSKWAWDDASKEYMEKKHLQFEDLTEEDNDRIYDYASMPAVYFLDWLMKNNYLSEELPKEENALSLFRDMDYVLTREDIKEVVLPFVDAYFDSDSVRHFNLYTLTYIYDYYQAIQNEKHFYYCVDYDKEISGRITEAIDKKYRNFHRMQYFEDLVSTEQIIHWHIADKDLKVTTIGKVSDDYIKACESSLNSMTQEDSDRLVRMLKEDLSYGDDYENMTFESFVNESSLDEILIFVPETDDPAYVILTENNIEAEHGLSIGFRNGHALYIFYRTDYEDPWDANWKDAYALSVYNTDIFNIQNPSDADQLLKEGKLVITEVNGQQIYTTKAALQMMQEINFCLDALAAYGYQFTSEWKINYYDNNPVPNSLYFKAYYRDETLFSQMITVWQ